MEMTLTIPDELATRLHSEKDRLPQILELGLRELHSTPPTYEGLSDVLEALARLPTPEEVLALRASPGLQDRVVELAIAHFSRLDQFTLQLADLDAA